MHLNPAHRPLFAAIAATVSCIFLGASFVATRAVVEQTGFASLGFLRYGIAVLVLLLFLPWLFRPRLKPTHILWLLLLGALQFGVFILFLNAGLAETLASRGGIVFGFIPILTMLVATAIGTDTLTALKAFAALLAIAGITLALADRAFGSGEPDLSLSLLQSYKGELLVFCGVCCGAVYNAFSGRALRLYSAVQVTFIAMLGGAAFTAIPAYHEGLVDRLSDLDWIAWSLVLFVALPGGAIGYFLFNWAIQQSSPLETAIYVPLSPISATLFGAWLLQEPISLQFILGLGVVIMSIFIANWAAKREKKAAATKGT